MSSIYTASRFSAYERVRAFNDDARAAGHTITHDWTRTDEFGADGHPLHVAEGDLAPDVAARYAMDDLTHGVRKADVIVFLAEDAGQGGFCGALIEFGYAFACGIPVFVVAPWRPSIFWHLPNVTVLPDENAVRERLGMPVQGFEPEAVAP
jgi:hypothetical protein